MNKKTITIKDEDSIGSFEVFGQWFECPNCREQEIFERYTRFCPACGVKIVWDRPGRCSDCGRKHGHSLVCSEVKNGNAETT